MLKILIAGCGYVGTATAKLFHQQGWTVTAWTRTGDIADHELPIAKRAVDLRQADDVRRNSFECDVVVHCASSGGGDAAEYRRIYRDGAANLAASFPRARLIFTSSTRVYEQRDGSWVDENSPAEPVSDKGKILREAEKAVLATGGIVLRLGGIYGPARSFLLQGVINGTASSSADRYVNQIHRDDIASAIFFLVQRPAIAPPRIFNVVDDMPVPRREILKWLSAQLRKPLSDLPNEDARSRGQSNKRVSNAKLRALGWSPVYPGYQEGFLRSVLSSGASSQQRLQPKRL
jgi:nucleoside-diphosphate-sugar epimerase